MKSGTNLIICFFGSLCFMLIGCDEANMGDFSSLTPTVLVTSTISLEPLSEYSPNITDKENFTFTGQVLKEQIFKKEIAKDLVFCLLPFNEGWRITLSSMSQGGCDFNSHDYVGLVSPPFYGINPIFIEGWHFRNENNTGPNDGTVNAPQEKRWFNFPFSKEDYHIVRQAGGCIFWNECDGINDNQAIEMIANTPKSRGTLTITHLELGNLVPGERAWIENMGFEVELGLPNGFMDNN